MVESARREREIQALKNIKQEEQTIKVSNIEIAMPTFSGDEKNEHPKSFLKDLSSYFIHKKITPANRIIVIENCLRGKASKWFNMIKDMTPTEETFKILFLKHCFSKTDNGTFLLNARRLEDNQLIINFKNIFISG